MADLTFTIKYSPEQLAEIQATLDAAGVRRGVSGAVATAINETIRHGRTQITKRLGQYLNMPAAAIKECFKVTRATKSSLRGTIEISRRPIPIQDFRPRVSRAAGVTVKFRRGGAGQSVTFRHAFQATMASGHTGIFQNRIAESKYAPWRGRYADRILTRGPRKGRPMLRRAIDEMFGPTVEGTFEKAKDLQDEELAKLNAYFEQRVDSKLQWMLDEAKELSEQGGGEGDQ